MMGAMKLTLWVLVASALLLRPALAQSADAAVGDAAVSDAAVSDAAVSDAAVSDAASDGAVGDGAVSDADVNGTMADATPGAAVPHDPDHPRGGGPLDPMQADPPPYVEPPYAARDGGSPRSESPSVRVAPPERDHTQACGCRFAGSDQTSAAVLLAPLLAFLLLARRNLQSV